MRAIIAMTFAILVFSGSLATPAQAHKYRSEFTVGTPSCDDRYRHTCDVSSSKSEPERKGKPVRQRVHGTPVASQNAVAVSAGTPALVVEARRWIGTNPTGKTQLWCARFMNFILERVGYHGTGSDLAMSFRSYGHRVSGPKVGAIAVLSRRGGGHVGIVSGIDANGNPVIISGNHGRRVGEGTYSQSRVVAYVMP